MKEQKGNDLFLRFLHDTATEKTVAAFMKY